MELKYAYKSYADGELSCSNRTFMELKCRLDVILWIQCLVLIVPLWNWNSENLNCQWEVATF